MSQIDENISFSINDKELVDNNDFDLNELLKSLESTNIGEIKHDFFVSQTLHYEVNFTVKELMLICEYYGISKDLKSNRCNKTEIIFFLVKFENEPNNEDIVSKRRNMWFYINEIKNDKFMKKYVLW